MDYSPGYAPGRGLGPDSLGVGGRRLWGALMNAFPPPGGRLVLQSSPTILWGLTLA
ncbi:hypothetical protein SUGI_1501310, partial [Cryptomeria japonica]